jgi:acetyl-CoA carboxylase biotin carboxyl carrier protein
VKFTDIDVKRLLELIREYDIAEISLQDGKTSIHIKKNNCSDIAAVSPTPARTAANEPSAAVETTFMDAPEEEEDAQTGPFLGAQEDFTPVTTPLVGTFYRAPAPDADVFVEVGDRIEKGDVLCIVEAMKSMNEIQSEVGGVIKEICVENAELVEFEQVLFKIDTSG